MKKVLLSFVLSAIAYAAQANCVGPVVNGQCLSGTSVHGFDSGQPQNYQSNSGAQYQYNLGNPVDRNAYRTDLDAQRRDQMNADPRRNLDRSSGQYGGGIQNPDAGCTVWPCR